MDYNCYDMNAYKLHIIKTKKFKTITVGIAFRRKILKEEITIRNLLKDLIINSSYNYPTEKSLIIETEKLYDLKLIAANYRIGNDTILTFKTRFLNENLKLILLQRFLLFLPSITIRLWILFLTMIVGFVL